MEPPASVPERWPPKTPLPDYNCEICRDLDRALDKINDSPRFNSDDPELREAALADEADVLEEQQQHWRDDHTGGPN
jgi:hypothetical protein